jgi:FtsP/CotA-like multicopper oxidase with cupredoxin domain
VHGVDRELVDAQLAQHGQLLQVRGRRAEDAEPLDDLVGHEVGGAVVGAPVVGVVVTRSATWLPTILPNQRHWSRAWKDTLDLPPAEVVEVAVRFSDHAGRFVFHCHNLEHEDMAMMGTIRTV